MGVRSLINWGRSSRVQENTSDGKTLDYFFNQYLQRQKKESHIICTQYVNNGLNTKLGFPRFYSFFHSLMVLYISLVLLIWRFWADSIWRGFILAILTSKHVKGALNFAI